MKSWKKIVTLITTVGMLIAPVNVNAQNHSDVSASNLQDLTVTGSTDEENLQEAGGYTIAGNGTNGIYINLQSQHYADYAATYPYAYTAVGCAWFAAARASEITGKWIINYDGQTWWNSGYANSGFSRGKTIQAKALACYSGHVAVVESVNGNNVTISEGGHTYYPNNGYCVIRNTTVSAVESGGFLGYVYLTPGSSSTDPSWSEWCDNVTETNACIYGKIDVGSRVQFTKAGVTLTDAGHLNDIINQTVENTSVNYSYMQISYNVQAELGVTLLPGHTYAYQMFADYGEKRYFGNVKTFTTVGATQHQWSDWTVVRNATTAMEGEKQRSCVHCKQVEKQSIPKLRPAATPTPVITLTPVITPKPVTTQKPVITPKPAVAPKPSAASSTAFTIKRGKTANVKASASWKNKKYSSSNKKVATVDKKGKVKAVGSGIAKITVKSGTKKIVYTITVPGTTAIKNIKSSYSVKKGKKLTLKPKLSYVATAENITYKSLKKSVATVSKNGVVTGKKKGSATITITSGKITKKCKVTVK